MTKKNVRRIKERKTAPHHMLLSAARHAYEDAVMNEVGSVYGQLVAIGLSSEITQGRSDKGSSPCPRPLQSHGQTSPAHPNFHRLQPRPGAGRVIRRSDGHGYRSTSNDTSRDLALQTRHWHPIPPSSPCPYQSESRGIG